MTSNPFWQTWIRRVLFGAAIFLAGCMALFVVATVYSLIFSETHHEDVPLTVTRARELGCPIPLPDSARNVQFAYYHHWIEFEMDVRFEASPEICKEHVKTVIEANAKNYKWLPHPTDLIPVTSMPPINNHDGLGVIPWFDIDNITHGVGRSGQGSYDPDIWIDDDRGIFYYRITD